jgi:hypothetical protein
MLKKSKILKRAEVITGIFDQYYCIFSLSSVDKNAQESGMLLPLLSPVHYLCPIQTLSAMNALASAILVLSFHCLALFLLTLFQWRMGVGTHTSINLQDAIRHEELVWEPILLSIYKMLSGKVTGVTSWKGYLVTLKLDDHIAKTEVCHTLYWQHWDF